MLTSAFLTSIITDVGGLRRRMQEIKELTENHNDQIDLCKDLIFRATFGKESAKYILKCLLNAVLKQAELPLVAELELKNPFNLSSYYDGKFTIMDIHAVDETGRHFDVEMQVQRQDYFDSRLFYYGTELYASSLQDGQGYDQLPRVVCIAFNNHPLDVAKPDVWFDKWQMHSTLGTGLGTDKLTNIFVRLPCNSKEEALFGDKFADQLSYWVKTLSSYSRLTVEEKRELSGSMEGFDELERRIGNYFSTEEGREVLSAQRKFDAWLIDFKSRQEQRYLNEHKARVEAERKSEEAERRSEEAERRSEEAERGREEAERRNWENQKKNVVRAFAWKYGEDVVLPFGWAEGLSGDELDAIADKVFASGSLQEALAALEK